MGEQGMSGKYKRTTDIRSHGSNGKLLQTTYLSFHGPVGLVACSKYCAKTIGIDEHLQALGHTCPEKPREVY